MMDEEKIEVDRAQLIKAVEMLMEFCQTQGMSELLAYMAMISITNTMTENLGFGYRPTLSEGRRAFDMDEYKAELLKDKKKMTERLRKEMAQNLASDKESGK